MKSENDLLKIDTIYNKLEETFVFLMISMIDLIILPDKGGDGLMSATAFVVFSWNKSD